VAAGRRFTDALRTIIVDITCVTEADQYGRALLLIMLRFGAQIIAKFPESFATVQPIVTVMEVADPNPGWFKRQIRFFWNDRHTTFPATR